MQLELKHLQGKLGIAFIFVTHDQEEAMTMADRVVVMHAGRIEQVGAGTDIYRQPATRFVAEFIGDANFMAYTATDGGTLQLEAQGLRVPLGGKPAPARGPQHDPRGHRRPVGGGAPWRHCACRAAAGHDGAPGLRAGAPAPDR
ncbi:hypothetical protein G6F23_014525 [Rhizopus arrhizus]|nr:hypothetical protein G6F23_014525 [Rhizopus arrhizus]